jgi:hypothetical protein
MMAESRASRTTYRLQPLGVQSTQRCILENNRQTVTRSSPRLLYTGGGHVSARD